MLGLPAGIFRPEDGCNAVGPLLGWGVVMTVDHATSAAEMATQLVDVVYAIEIHPERRFTYVSPSVVDLLGYTPEDCYADPTLAADFMDPRAREVSTRTIEDQHDGPCTFRAQWQGRDGRTIWVEHRCRRVIEPDGRVLLFGAARDVSDEVAAVQALDAERERYRILAESARDVVFRTDANRAVVWASPSVTDALGWQPAEVVGRDFATLVHPSDFEGAREKRERVMEQGGTLEACELRIACSDGSWKWMRVANRPLPGGSGEPLGSVEEMRDIEEEVRAREELLRESDHDALTTVAGFPLGLRRVEETLARRSPGSWALLCAGVNGLSGINQALTHLAGDRVLQEVARRLVAAAGAHDRVARIAGDEFIVLLPEIQSPADAAAAADRLLGAVAGPVSLGPNQIEVTASIGIAIAEGQSAGELVRDATIAARQARQRSTNSWELLDDVAARAAQQTLQLQAEIRDGLQKGEFHAWFQPVVRLSDRSVRGYEALVRWVKPDGTVLLPGEFLHAALGTPLILELDRTIIDQSLDLLTRLPEDQHVAINVDASCLGTAGLKLRVRDEVTRLGIDPRRVELEVTETLIITAMAEVLENMRDLEGFGIRWWIDDFGTGYSSISHLKDLPVHGMKLDRSFTSEVTRSDGRALGLAQGLAGLARGLGLDTTAEGIETTEQANIVRAAGWELGQGWLFGRPVPAHEIA